MTPQDAERIYREYREAFTQRLIESLQILEPALTRANQELNRAVAETHEHARRERHPSITANPGKLHRRYRRRP